MTAPSMPGAAWNPATEPTQAWANLRRRIRTDEQHACLAAATRQTDRVWIALHTSTLDLLPTATAVPPRDAAWYRIALSAYDLLREAGAYAHLANLHPWRCAAVEPVLTTWLQAPDAQRLGLDDQVHRINGDTQVAHLSTVLAAAQDARVFGIPGHRVELATAPGHADTVVRVVVDTPTGLALASEPLELGVLLDPDQTGVAATVAALRRVADAANAVYAAHARAVWNQPPPPPCRGGGAAAGPVPATCGVAGPDRAAAMTGPDPVITWQALARDASEARPAIAASVAAASRLADLVWPPIDADLTRDASRARTAWAIFHHLQRTGAYAHLDPPVAMRCQADEVQLRSWLAAPSDLPGYGHLTVAESWGIEPDFAWDSDGIGGRMATLVEQAQRAGLYGLPDHTITLRQITTDDPDDDPIIEHQVTLTTPTGAVLASPPMAADHLTGDELSGVDAAVAVLTNTAYAVNELLTDAYGLATQRPSRGFTALDLTAPALIPAVVQPDRRPDRAPHR